MLVPVNSNVRALNQQMWPFSRKSVYFSAPGPTPWYAGCRASAVCAGGVDWSWEFPTGKGLDGITWLRDSAGEVRLILDFQCYVQALDDGSALIWVSIGRDPEYPARTPAIRFILVFLDTLAVIPTPEEATAQMRERKAPACLKAEESHTFECPTTHTEGDFTVTVPDAFQGLGEVLALADFGPAEAASNGFDKMFRAIFAMNFSEGSVSVIPQEWFNSGAFDFGYQWVTRVQRDEKTGLIVGEGIRISPFTLDDTGKQQRKMGRRDGYYHVGR